MPAGWLAKWSSSSRGYCRPQDLIGPHILTGNLARCGLRHAQTIEDEDDDEYEDEKEVPRTSPVVRLGTHLATNSIFARIGQNLTGK